MAKTRSMIAETALHALDIPVLAVDREQCILFSNRAADELLDGQTTCLLRRNGSLAGRDPSNQEALAHLLHSARGARRLCIRLAMSPAHPELYALAVPVASRRLLLVLLIDGRRALRWRAEHIAQLFGLTPAEGRLAHALASGKTLMEHASGTGVSLNTVRSQLRHVLAKAGMRRQTDLVRALAGLPALRI
jgi:DNA-binding CsgD family transcriptional regulator